MKKEDLENLTLMGHIESKRDRKRQQGDENVNGWWNRGAENLAKGEKVVEIHDCL